MLGVYPDASPLAPEAGARKRVIIIFSCKQKTFVPISASLFNVVLTEQWSFGSTPGYAMVEDFRQTNARSMS